MGFSGGGSNVLLPHTHDGTVSQDGGSLDFNNITQSNSSAGQVFYSDGVHLQQLSYPGVPAGETLTAAALSTAPSWVAATPAATAWEIVANITNGGVANLASGTFSHYDQLQMYCWRENNAASSTGFIFNSTGGGGQYSSRFFTDFTTDENNATTGAVVINGSYNTSDAWFVNMNIMNLTGEEKLCTWNAVLGNGAGNQNLGTSFGTAKTTFTTDITSIQCTQDSGAVSNQKAGSRMIVFGAN